MDFRNYKYNIQKTEASPSKLNINDIYYLLIKVLITNHIRNFQIYHILQFLGAN